MAAPGHTPYWRNDPISTSRSTGLSFGGASIPGQANGNSNDHLAMEETTDSSTLGYTFGYDTSISNPGNTLLDSTENDMLSTFFDNPNGFNFEFGQDGPFNNFQFDTLGDSSQNPFNLNYIPTATNQMTAFNVPGNQRPSGLDGADDASAASFLVNMSSQNQNVGMPNNTAAWNNVQSHAAFMIPSDDVSSAADGSQSAQQLRQVPYPNHLSSRQAMSNRAYNPSPSTSNNPNLDASDYSNFYTQGSSGAQSRTISGGQGRTPVPYSFGSDSNFSSQGYQGMGSSLQRDKVFNLMEIPHLHELSGQTGGRDGGAQGAMYGGQSGDGSSSGSAMASHMNGPPTLQTSNLGQTVNDKRRKAGYGDNDPQSGSRKRRFSQDGDYDARRESNIDQDGGYDEDYSPITPAKRRQKSAVGRQGSSTPGSPASSNGGEGSTKKKNRENKARPNLSESQKRENHIISEQKRRNVIKQAFNDLNRMVPNLQGGKSGLSKAEMLKEVVNFIEATVQGNKIMSELLQGPHTKMETS